MKYLIIDASLSGTGIRDYYEGGYVSPESLCLKEHTIQRLKSWLLKYENEHYNGFNNNSLIDELDNEGKDIALIIKNEISDVKIEYFSDARMTKEKII
jgi:hypothetical protein